MKLFAASWLVLQWSVLTVAGEPPDASVTDIFDTNTDEELILADDSSEVKVGVEGGYYYYAPSPTPSWPTFASAADLEKHPWGTYYKLVYGAIPTDNYPRSPIRLWMFYSDVISQAGVTDYPASVGNCPTDGKKKGQVYNTNNAYSPLILSGPGIRTRTTRAQVTRGVR